MFLFGICSYANFCTVVHNDCRNIPKKNISMDDHDIGSDFSNYLFKYFSSNRMIISKCSYVAVLFFFPFINIFTNKLKRCGGSTDN